MIVSQELDPTADEVVLALGERGVPVFRIDRAWLPQRLTLEAELRDGRWAGCLSAGQRRVELDDIRSVWHRWRSTFVLSSQLSRQDWQHAEREARAGFDGVICSLDARHVNHPHRVAALPKPMELVLAARCGLDVPATVISNSSHQVRLMDVRVVVVGERIFPVAIHPLNEAARVDFRADYRALRHDVIELPGAVEQGIRRFMAESGLLVASMDFSVDRDGRYYFLESNPAGGQYGWLEAKTLGAKTGVRLTEAVADLLAQGWSGLS